MEKGHETPRLGHADAIVATNLAPARLGDGLFAANGCH
jgi:hypothetical protein